jgi:putative ABC transport system permease protein
LNWKDIILQAYHSVMSNKLRTLITVSTIALGITALIGILTSIVAMQQKLKSGFSIMGANTFSIRANERILNLTGTTTTKKRKDETKKAVSSPIITANQAQAFKDNYTSIGNISIRLSGQQNVTTQHAQQNITHDCVLLGGDENYVSTNGFVIAKGRNFNLQEANANVPICLVGSQIVKKLYKANDAAAVGATLLINGLPFTIAGTLASKGSSAFVSFDNVILAPNGAVAAPFNFSKGYIVSVQVPEVQYMDMAIQQSEQVMKAIRNIPIDAPPNFSFEKSDRLANLFLKASNSITLSAIAIGLITLFGASIGLMNIMLVTVNERTREVGIQKALGAKNKFIQKQFIIESILIAIIGALIGTLFGILLGNIVAYLLQVSFVFPWQWVLLGFVLCIISGLAAGAYPAIKAAKLQPTVALRYE